MAFQIAFLDQVDEHPYGDSQSKAARGAIILEDHSEEFLANLGEWTREDYLVQWRHALTSIIAGSPRAALITTYSSPERSSHIEWWPMYRASDIVHVQNQLLFYDSLKRQFSAEQTGLFLEERETVNEDGDPLSEWNVSLRDIKLFLDSL